MPAPYAVTFVGTLNDTLLTWTRNGHRLRRLSVRIHGDAARRPASQRVRSADAEPSARR